MTKKIRSYRNPKVIWSAKTSCIQPFLYKSEFKQNHKSILKINLNKRLCYHIAMRNEINGTSSAKQSGMNQKQTGNREK